MEVALAVHGKARVVLQCWILLIMRRRADARREKDALYDRLQPTTPISPQEKIRYWRGAMLLCHLLIEREVAEADSLLDRYLVDYYFPWSSAVNDRDETFYHAGRRRPLGASGVRLLQAERQQDDCGEVAGAEPLFVLSRIYISHTRFSHGAHLHDRRDQHLLRGCTRSKDADRSFPPPPTRFLNTAFGPLVVLHTEKRRRTGASFDRLQLQSLKQAVERWARRLRRQLLQAPLADDKERIRQVADKLQAPPLLGKAVKDTAE